MALMRNDPESAAAVLQHALAGEVDAQFAAGLIYAEGRGVPIDLVQSFYWLTQAVNQGDTDAQNLRSVVGSQMTDAEFERAQHLIKAAASVSHEQGEKQSETRH